MKSLWKEILWDYAVPIALIIIGIIKLLTELF